LYTHSNQGDRRRLRVQPLEAADGGTVRGQEVGMRIHRDSVLWIVAVAVVFTLAVLVFTPLRMSLGWDETVYASQISDHLPIMRWGPERARGMPLIVAPITLLGGSPVVLRVYLSVLAGLGLFLGLLAWRGVKPAWVLALAGVIFGGLAIVEVEASQVFPNYWIALGGLAGAGLFLQGVTREAVPRRILALLAGAAAFTALMRPPDAVAIFGPLMVIAAVIMVQHTRARHALDRHRAVLLLAVAAGLAIGGGEWVSESYRYFSGPIARLHQTSSVVGGTKFNPETSLRIINGGRASSVAGYPGVTGWSHPELLWWWLAFLVLALLGVYVAGRSLGWLVAAAPFISALAVYALYTLPVRDNARYLQPCWALLAVPAAEGLGWLIVTPKGRTRLAAAAAAVTFLVVELGTQHTVLVGQWAILEAAATANDHTVSALKQFGVRSPCTVATVNRPHFSPVSGPVSYYVGCRYAGSRRRLPAARGTRVVVLVQGAGHPWHYAVNWPAHLVPDSGGTVAYIQPLGSVRR